MSNVLLRRRVLPGRYSVIAVIACLFLLVSIFTRLALLFSTSASGINFGQVAGIFFIGLLYDVSVASFAVIPFVFHLWLQNDFIYRMKLFPAVCVVFVVLLSLILFTRIIPKDFSPPLYIALIAYIVLRFVFYLVLYFSSVSFRQKWRKAVLYFGLTVFVFLLLLNAVSEWVFWQEFFSRYNFIAVDYLVYTNEVLGNIEESYPIGWILLVILIISICIIYLSRRSVYNSVMQPMFFAKRSIIATAFLLLPIISYFTMQEKWRHFSRNEFANSLAGNGIFEFMFAYKQNALDFYKFYQTIPDSTAFRIVRESLREPNAEFLHNNDLSIEREITYSQPERKLNVVLISVESLSAGYMKAFGDTNNITPYLDSLKTHSIFFKNLYASGTRTVRGLEALSLSIPPTPGQSIVKRPDNAKMFSLGSIFRSKGYITQYIYGGYSYFDNMKTFFENNSYSVIDRSFISNKNIHHQNIWGVADEDLFALALQTLDSNYQTKRPFFTQIMTVSNHRPYTYPDGRVDIPSASHTRYGAVKYTDYAINSFLKQAASRKWFDSTIFVIVSDHCAGSSGSAELPVTGYHIPMLIYAPSIFKPAEVEELTAQIDIAPTILGLLHFDYRSKFFGQDVFNTSLYNRHAFISTYQGLGYLKDGQLVIQSPVKNLKQYVPNFKTGNATLVANNDSLIRQAISFYQCANWVLKNKKQGE